MNIFNWFKTKTIKEDEYFIGDCVVLVDDLPRRFNTFSQLFKVTNKYKVDNKWMYELDNIKSLVFSARMIRVNKLQSDRIGDIVVLNSELIECSIYNNSVIKYKIIDYIKLENSGSIMVGLQSTVNGKTKGYVYLNNIQTVIEDNGENNAGH